MFSKKECTEMSLCHSKFILTNVTALKFVEHLLFAGVAGNLLLYVASDGDYCKYKKFYQINIFSGKNIYGIVSGKKMIVFGDKCIAVLDGISEQSSDLRMNVISSWTIKDWIWDAIWLVDDEIAILTAHNVLLRYKWNCELLSETRCEDLSILYSGKIINSKWEDLVILSGTVYQEIVIWSVGDSKDVCSREVLHRLKGHKGVIFSISYDPDSKQICSTSDDRTVRVWSVNFPEGNTAIDRWSKAQITLKYSVFGHTARVWRSHFISEGRLISIGEDGQICLWAEDGQLAGRWQGTSALWCLDYRESHLATGAADGSITIWPISTIPPPTSHHLPGDVGQARCACISSCGEAVVLTDSGRLILYSAGVWTSSTGDPRFSSYAVLSLSPARNLLALATINGVLVIYSVIGGGLTKLVDQDILHCRIYALNWLNNNVLIVCGEEGVLTLWHIHQPVIGLEKRGDFVLPPCKERWITSAAMAAIHLVCGDRQGSVHLFCNNSNQKEPLDSLYKLHGSRGVSDIKFIDDLFYTSGRDGTFRKLTVTNNNLQVLSTYNLSMDWAAAVMETEIFGTVIIGFHDVSFIVWSLKEKLPLIELKCGGGHRSWDCLIDETSRNIIIVFIKEKKVHHFIYSLEKIAHRIVRVGHHKKSINSACLVSLEDGRSFLVTGGEDTSVAISLWEDKKVSLHNTMDGHLSSVRAVCCVGNIVISAGGRAQLIVWSFSTSRGDGTLKLLKSHMIREERRERRPWREAEPLVDPEMRYMALDAIRVLTSHTSFTIAAACSDGLLRLMEYNEATNSLTTMGSLWSEQKGCLLTVRLLRTEERLMCLTTATDGHLSVWHLSASLDTRPVSHRLHSLGINCCSLYQSGGGRMVVATGGDDSSLCLSLIDLKGKLEFTIIEHVHTAQITGVRLTADFLMSVGLDRMLSIMAWCLDGASIRTLPIAKFVTSIPDAHGLLLRPTDQKEFDILIFGSGIEIIHFNGSTKSFSMKK